MPIDQEILNSVELKEAREALNEVFTSTEYRDIHIGRTPGAEVKTIPSFLIKATIELTTTKDPEAIIQAWLENLKADGIFPTAEEGKIPQIARRIADVALLKAKAHVVDKKGFHEDRVRTESVSGLAAELTPLNAILNTLTAVLFKKDHLETWHKETSSLVVGIDVQRLEEKSGQLSTKFKDRYTVHNHLKAMIAALQDPEDRDQHSQLNKIIAAVQSAAKAHPEITKIPTDKSIPDYYRENKLTNKDKDQHAQIYAAIYRALLPIMTQKKTSPELLRAAADSLQKDLRVIEVNPGVASLPEKTGSPGSVAPKKKVAQRVHRMTQIIKNLKPLLMPLDFLQPAVV